MPSFARVLQKFEVKNLGILNRLSIRYSTMPKPSILTANTRLLWLLLAALLTVGLWQIPFGNFILYPFTILATWFHEMGHGLTAIALGGTFEKLLIFPNGSGLAYHSGRLAFGAFGRALVSAGGLMGPPIAGAVLLIASRGRKSARRSLALLGVLLILSTLLWVRTLVGWLLLPALGIAIVYLALETAEWVQVFAVQFLGVQACISSYRQLDYLFSSSATINGKTMLSDTGRISNLLILPHWFWGLLLTVLMFVILAESLKIACRQKTNV